MDILAFLEARIAQDEMLATAALADEYAHVDVGGAYADLVYNEEGGEAITGRILAECKAKRAVIALANEWRGDANDYGQLDSALWLLAGAYADHPDFESARAS